MDNPAIHRLYLRALWFAAWPEAVAFLPECRRDAARANASAYLDGRARGLAFKLAEQEAEITGTVSPD
jgi:hypothetical protein